MLYYFQMKGLSWRRTVLTLLSLCSFASPVFIFAQETCGNFLYGSEDNRTIVPIEDCENPFGIFGPNPNLEVQFNGIRVENGGTYEFLGVSSEFLLSGTHPDAFMTGVSLYKHEGSDYLSIDTDDSSHTFTQVGTYTLVVYEDGEPILSKNWLQKILAFFTPVAHAFPGPSLALTFEVIEAPPEPVGVSNILFLPGIQASRLYVNDSGSEEKLWEPGGDVDVARLAMTESGESIEDVYTKDVIDEKLGVAIGGNIYKGFLQYLVDLDDVSGGPLVRSFPYDWRQDVFDIVANGTKFDDGQMVQPTDILESLAELSPTEKVTIIAHSNGGLLAKAILLKLEEEGKTNLVDKVIFIATPHLGTPKGLMALLHGYDQRLGLGIIAQDEVIREVMQNMPGVYGLLPSETYVSSLTEPMISFDSSSSTKIYRDRYGFTISNMNEYTDFLEGQEGRIDAGNLVNEISTANGTMLEDGLQRHRELLDNWDAPNSVEVFNIVGTGLATPNSIEYREFLHAPCPSGQCVLKGKLEPVVHFTRYGDETVVSRSSSDTNQDVNQFYFNLRSANRGVLNLNNEHANITEIPEIQVLTNNILHGSSTEDIEFVSDTEPIFSEDVDIKTIHSPARIYLKDTQGNITGRTEADGEQLSEIPGSSYFEIGGVKYVLVPSDINYEVVIEGEGTGVYTHESKRLHGDNEETQHNFTATSTPTMITKYTKTNGSYSEVTIDTDGNGTIDVTMTPDGDIIKDEVTYDDLVDAIRALSISKIQKRILLELASQAEKLSNKKGKKLNRVAERALLIVIQKSVDAYKKSKIITEVERQNIHTIISQLVK